MTGPEDNNAKKCTKQKEWVDWNSDNYDLIVINSLLWALYPLTLLIENMFQPIKTNFVRTPHYSNIQLYLWRGVESHCQKNNCGKESTYPWNEYYTCWVSKLWMHEVNLGLLKFLSSTTLIIFLLQQANKQPNHHTFNGFSKVMKDMTALKIPPSIFEFW